MITRKQLEIGGWALFTAGSAVFLVDSILHGNLIAGLGSGAFLIGCVFFLISEKF